MALTQKQIEEMDKITGLGSITGLDRVNELKSLTTFRQPAEEKQGFLSKAGEVVTGGKFGQNVAQAVYMGGQYIKGKLGFGNTPVDITNQYLKNGDTLLKMANETTDKKRKLELVKQAQGMYNDAGMVTEDIIGHVRNIKQQVGDAAGLMINLASAGGIGATFGAGTKAVGIGRGIVQGAKVGAITGGLYGGASGVAGGLQEDKGALDIVKEGVKGTLIGAAAGGVIGGVTGGIAGGIRNKPIKEQEFVNDLVMEKPTTKVKASAIRKGSEGVTEQGLFKPAKIKPTARDLKTANDVKDLVSSKKTLLQNLDSIESKVDEINNYVKSYAETHKLPFNTNQLKSRLSSGKSELKLIFASDSNAEKTYNAATDAFMDSITKKNTPGLIDARQTFDKLPAVKKLLDSSPIGENARKEIVLTIREKANQYVADLLPEGNEYRDLLYKESNMINAIKNIALKNTNIIGESKLTLLTKKYPIIATAVGTAAITLLGLKGLGVGRSIISSSD